MLRLAERCHAAGDEDSRQELSRALEQLGTFARELTGRYRVSRELRLPTPLREQLAPRIEDDLERFRTSLREIERYLEDGDKTHLARGCTRAREAADRLLDSFDQLKTEERSFPRYSESPFLHQLAYFARGFASGQLPQAPLREFLGWFEQRRRAMARDVAEWARSPAENPRVAELTPAFERLLRHLGRGLTEMVASLDRGDKARLGRYCDAVLEVGQELMALHTQLTQALAPTVCCPRCSTSNPPASRVCGNCGARLPELAGAPVSSFAILSQATPTRPRFSYLARLEEAVEQHFRGELSTRELGQTVEWFAARVRAGRQALEGLAPPERFPTSEMERTARAARNLMADGSKRLEAGVKSLQGYLSGAERRLAEQGLESVRAGAEQVAEAQRLLRPPGAQP